MNIKNIKIEQMKKIEELENIILELEEWQEGEELDSNIKYIVGEVEDSKHRHEKIRFYKENISMIKANIPEDNKLYLSEIIKKEKPQFGSNTLILAPVGSGKTTLIKEVLINNKPEKVLMLVSNTALKDSVSPKDNVSKEKMADRTFTTQNRTIYGKGEYKIHVMSYAEFGRRIEINNNFIKDIKQIFCDEIHSLPNYQRIADSTGLSHAIKTLFMKHEGKEIYYFTATDEYLKYMEKRRPGVLDNVTILDYRNHPDIKQYIPLSEYKFSHIEQIRPHLRARLRTFDYFGYKALAFSRTIAGQKRIAEIAEEEGFNPLVLWSINNADKKMKMTDEQLHAREYLLTNGEMPEPYNFLVINSAMQEGWDLHDSKIKLAIMNTTSETEKIQALGRLRNDIDILVYKVKSRKINHADIEIPNEYLNIPLTAKRKEELCEKLNIINSEGFTSKWRVINPLLDNDSSGYKVLNHTKNIDGKRTRVTTISIKEDVE
ncbi:MAG TPA: DEAD/DEAH box helicase family protein [Clostridiales bacterium]|nr:DEAD/DEAH box helicase family protein [Clostridiales bacterium]